MNKQLVTFLVGALLAFGLVLALLYVRQRLFTRAEPIVLAT